MEAERVIVVGAGLWRSRHSARGRAARQRVTVFEAAELVGGAAAYSGGQVWVGANHVAAREGIEDDLERAERYVRDIARDHPEVLDEARDAALADGRARGDAVLGGRRRDPLDGDPRPRRLPQRGRRGALEGRYLTNEVDRRQRARRVARQAAREPVLPGRHDLRGDVRQGPAADRLRRDGGRAAGVQAFGLPTAERQAADPLTFGTGVVASFLARVLREDAIEILHRAPGDRAADATTTAPWSASAPRARTGRSSAAGRSCSRPAPTTGIPSSCESSSGSSRRTSAASRRDSLRGDGIRLARAVGGATSRDPADGVPMLPGWPPQTGAATPTAPSTPCRTA